MAIPVTYFALLRLLLAAERPCIAPLDIIVVMLRWSCVALMMWNVAVIGAVIPNK